MFIYVQEISVSPGLSHLSNIKYIYIFGSIALFIIILACVNFMNLSTARSAKRAKEVGIRKVTGSTRGQLVKQFLAEAFLYSFISSLHCCYISCRIIKTFFRSSLVNQLTRVLHLQQVYGLH